MILGALVAEALLPAPVRAAGGAAILEKRSPSPRGEMNTVNIRCAGIGMAYRDQNAEGLDLFGAEEACGMKGE